MSRVEVFTVGPACRIVSGMQQRYQDYFRGKKVTLMGLGLLGRGVGDARFLAECGAELIVTDLKTEGQLASSLEQLKAFPNITFHLGGHAIEDFQGRDLILKAAGVPKDSPYIAEAKKQHTPVRMSADLFAELAGVPVVGITGTRGKTTTTQMVAHILRAAGEEVLVGGNVRGVSTLSLLKEVSSRSVAVLELDSWQLQGFGEARMSPHIAVFTTFYPDHMNYYKDSMEAYFADKANIFLNQEASDFFILGEQVAPCIKTFGYQNKIKAVTTLAGDKTLPQKTMLRIPGEHNRHNAGLASAAARALGVEDVVIRGALESFEAIEWRLQFLRELQGIKIYNDNNSTTPDATIAALRAVGNEEKKSVVLIMGGADKLLDMSGLLKEVSKYCKSVVLLAGAGTDRIAPELPGAPIYSNMGEVVAAAWAACAPGDTLLFSPAFTSFSMFNNEYERNDQFVELVSKLA